MAGSEPVTESVLAELDSLRQEVALLRATVAELHGVSHAADVSERPSAVPADTPATSRRRLLALAGGAAGAVVVSSAIAGARPVAAANGQPVLIANTATADGTPVVGTFLNYRDPDHEPVVTQSVRRR